jgi:hypothetical protein
MRTTYNADACIYVHLASSTGMLSAVSGGWHGFAGRPCNAVFRLYVASRRIYNVLCLYVASRRILYALCLFACGFDQFAHLFCLFAQRARAAKYTDALLCDCEGNGR